MSLKFYLSLFILLCCLSVSACSEPQKLPSAAENVHILDIQFAMPGLQRQRTVRLYLPPGYHNETDYYPVIYMHDGQNLFDDATSYVGEWHVDETLNKLAQTQGLKVIVVGIDNGQQQRMNELSPWPNEQYGVAEGAQYLRFVTEVIKPYIDTHYRTLSDRKNTAIIGSSMGGLMSHYAIFHRPDVFSKAGIYSPSYWYSQKVFDFSHSNPLPKDAKLDFIVGRKEGKEMVENMLKMTALVQQQSHPKANLRQNVVDEAEHNEAFWASQFASTVTWLFAK